MKTFTSLLFVLLSFTLPAFAEDNCSVSLDANDRMQYSTDQIQISRKCDKVTITLNHTGALPKTIMGHNIVITEQSAMQSVVSQSAKMGLNNNYIDSDTASIIAASAVAGGGESVTISINPLQFEKDKSYVFFCAVPGHFAGMQGTVKVI